MVENGRRRSRRSAERDRRAAPEPVGGVVESVFSRLGIAEDVDRATVIADWEEIVGVPIARVARPVGLRRETLFVEVESPSWRMELSLMRPQLMRRLNAGRRRGRIEKIVFVQSDGPLSEERDGEG